MARARRVRRRRSRLGPHRRQDGDADAHVDEEYLRFNEVAAYTTALVLALLAVLTLIS